MQPSHRYRFRMIYLEFIIRVAGATLLLAIAAVMARDAWSVRTARFGFFLAICLAAVMATSLSEQSVTPPEFFRWVFMPLSASSAILIWWFSLALLDDDFRLGPLEWSVAGVWTALGLLNLPAIVALEPAPFPWAGHIRSAVAVAIVAHIAYVAIRGRKGDLVEARRRARVMIAAAISALFLVDLMSERVFDMYYTPLNFNVVQLSAFLAVVVWSFFWLLRAETSVLAFERRPPSPPPESSLSAREKTLHLKLQTAMETEKAFLEPELSIGALAKKVGAPEHQLRALINKAMGHRNFRAFLNGYRMTEAKAALGDPEKSSLPILTIAMDSGFASLASFNRAFKLETGETPSAFRKRALAGETPAQN
ncbi:MAG: helix-turn-helix domain-containing protein [Pseudomonadota bacterium]